MIDRATETGVWLGVIGVFISVCAGEQIIGSLTKKSLTPASASSLPGTFIPSTGGVLVGTVELLIMQANVNTILGCGAMALGSLIMRRRLRKKIRRFENEVK